VDTTQTTHISLCAGYGGIDLGLKQCVSNLRTIAYSEIEAFAVENLLARMEEGNLDAAPVWSDLRTFPWTEFSGLVDILSAGYPCQPFSHSGDRKGTDDPRHLWLHIAAGISVLKPRMCFFENVEGHISMGLSTVISDLESMGYRATWGLFSAVECGAAHNRKRVFILAYSLRERGLFSAKWKQSTEQMLGGKSKARRTEDGWACNECGSLVFNGCSCEHNESQCAKCGEWTYPFVWSPEDGCSNCGESWPNWNNPATWPIESTVCGSNDGSANRVDRLRLLGNGVVPATAALAFKTLLQKVL